MDVAVVGAELSRFVRLLSAWSTFMLNLTDPRFCTFAAQALFGPYGDFYDELEEGTNLVEGPQVEHSS